MTEGALVTANQTDALATITRLDPVFVDIQESAADLLALRETLAQGGATPTTAQVRIKLPNGSLLWIFGYGRIQSGDGRSDHRHGDNPRALSEPASLLLPGMFVTAEFAQAIDTAAYLVPQSAVTRDPKGNATIWVVGPGKRRPAGHRRRAHARYDIGW